MLKLCRPLCVLPFTVDIGGITHPPALAQASTTIFSVQTCNHKLFSPPLERRPLTGGVLTESPVRAYSKAKLPHFWLASFSVSAKYWLMIFLIHGPPAACAQLQRTAQGQCWMSLHKRPAPCSSCQRTLKQMLDSFLPEKSAAFTMTSVFVSPKPLSARTISFLVKAASALA